MDLGEQLIRDEGRRSKPYLDKYGNVTIGIGRNLTAKGLSSEEIHLLFINDVNEATQLVRDMVPVSRELDEVRRMALVNMCFNMGIASLLTFHKMLQALADKDWKRACRELLDSKYASDVGDRAQRIGRQILTGEWQ
jgi:lysozyme